MTVILTLKLLWNHVSLLATGPVSLGAHRMEYFAILDLSEQQK